MPHFSAFEERQVEKRQEIERKSIFPTESLGVTKVQKSEKSQEKVQKQRASLGISLGNSKSKTVASISSTATSPSQEASSAHQDSEPICSSPPGCTASSTHSGFTEDSSGMNEFQTNPAAPIATAASSVRSSLPLVSGDYGSSSDDSS